jgi:acetolactate synthase-1/3 small subunit
VSELHTIAFIVENKPGVLFNISNMFRKKNFNIHSISVGAIPNAEVVRITIVVQADARGVYQVVEQLDKMVDVVEVKRLDPMRIVRRELALVKLTTTDPMAREEALTCINDYHGLILNIDPDTLIAEVTGESDEIDAFLELVKPIGIIEFSRTGITALEKGRLRLERGEK